MITANIVFPDAGNTKETIIYTINGDGEVTVKMSVDARNSGMGNFIKIGSLMTLPEGFENVTWYGNGPVETFNDRKTNARQGIYTSTVSDFFYPYLKRSWSASSSTCSKRTVAYVYDSFFSRC